MTFLFTVETLFRRLGYGLSMFTNRSRLPSFLIEIIILEVTVLLFLVVLGGCSFPMEFLRGTFLSGFPFGRGYGG